MPLLAVSNLAAIAVFSALMRGGPTPFPVVPNLEAVRPVENFRLKFATE